MHIDIKNTAYKSVKHLFFLLILKQQYFMVCANGHSHLYINNIAPRKDPQIQNRNITIFVQ